MTKISKHNIEQVSFKALPEELEMVPVLQTLHMLLPAVIHDNTISHFGVLSNRWLVLPNLEGLQDTSRH